LAYYSKTRKLLPTIVRGRCLVLFFSFLLLVGCDSDIRAVDQQSADTPSDGTSPVVQIESAATITVIEGGDNPAIVPISVTRAIGRTGAITLSARGATTADEQQLSLDFQQASLRSTESSTNLTIRLDIGPRPLKTHIRTILLSASDGISPTTSTRLNFTVEPTDKPDLYLIVGQSNAVGFSEDNAKMAEIGEEDAPNARIQQLNVTGNDSSNFGAPADFTLAPNIYNIGEALSPAIDPLHTGYSSLINGKPGKRIGFGLSFAKDALVDTTADIVLVPTAWSDTGFCTRSTNRFPGSGWNATEKSNPALSGTLLHDRAIARANSALSLTDGILRGILWHQGEADSDDIACANVYEENLIELANSLRVNIAADARGPAARTVNSDIPFIVGTMSQGADSRDNQLPFSSAKLIVDAAHRNVENTIPMSDFVNNDDLVPPSYPCGEGTCVHFGALALRQMGTRYYAKLKGLLP
jgi:hypothetical protein